MHKLWDSIKSGYLRLIEPVADFLVQRNVNPNVITTIGTVCTLAAAAIFASGHISIGGWVLGITAVFDVLDGIVARRTGRQTTFGAFYDSSLDRVSDGALLGGLLVFYSVESPHHSVPMVVISLLAILGTFLTSYTRARAESLGIDAKVGLMQRPERVALLSAPQAFFGLAFDGWVLAGIITFLCVTSWITAVQRMQFVYRQTLPVPRTSPLTYPRAHSAAGAAGAAASVQKDKSELGGSPATARAQSPQ